MRLVDVGDRGPVGDVRHRRGAKSSLAFAPGTRTPAVAFGLRCWFRGAPGRVRDRPVISGSRLA